MSAENFTGRSKWADRDAAIAALGAFEYCLNPDRDLTDREWVTLARDVVEQLARGLATDPPKWVPTLPATPLGDIADT